MILGHVWNKGSVALLWHFTKWNVIFRHSASHDHGWLGMNMLALTKAADCLKYRVVLGMDTLIIAHIEVYLLGIAESFEFIWILDFRFADIGKQAFSLFGIFWYMGQNYTHH